jgi:uncharacterized protein (TIGR03067 family)
VSAERDGQPDPVSRDAVATFTADGKLKVKFADDSEGEGTYKVDPAAKPRSIDYTLDKGKILRGIYSLEGDKLKVCRADAGRERPGDFTTRADSGRMLFVLERLVTKVAGKVSFAGKPVPKGKVSFHPRKGKPVVAEIKDGAYAAEAVPAGEMVLTFEFAGVPKKYTDPKTTPLQVRVQPGENNLDIELTD